MKNMKKTSEKGKLRIASLGGLQEIGKNMTVFEYGDDIVVIDAGMGFPDEEMPGVDLVIPDISYLVKNAEKIRGILITHGHEDHIGAIPYVLSQINVPVYGTRLSLGIIEGKLDENPPPYEPELYTVEAGDILNLGVFKAEFINVNHSIADACAISLKTPVGVVFHTGDFKLDVSPIDGKMMDITRMGEIGKAGVELLLCESTNAERAGYTPSERTVGYSFEKIFSQYEDRRLIITTFSSNVHRVQQIINTAHKHKRKVCVIGRSMVNVIGAAAELGYMDLPDGVLIDPSEIKRFRPEEITLITTGSQGEPMSALYRIAFGEHDKVKLSSSDVVVMSSSAIPGNEKLIGRIVNELVNHGVSVLRDSAFEVHVSGHAYRDELKLLTSLIKPKFFMPIHGEYRHLAANKDLAEEVGIPSNRVIISDVGKVVELDKKSAKINGVVPAGKVLVDGYGVGDVGSIVLNDRRHLSQDGLIVVVASIDRISGMLLSSPEIVSRGFVYVREAEGLMEEIREIAVETICRCFERSRRPDRIEVKNMLKDELTKYVYSKTKRKPMILPVIIDV
jgi:ribonuclease J